MKTFNPQYLTKNNLWDSSWLKKKHPEHFNIKKIDMHTSKDDEFCTITLRVSSEQAQAILFQSEEQKITQSDVIRNLINENLLERKYNCHQCNYNFKTTDDFQNLTCPECLNDWSNYGFHETD